jgi:hypothetical protein
VYVASRSEDTVRGNLVLVSSIANQLLEATAATATQASEQVLAQPVEHFDLHYSFLRYSDHDIRASVLAAEWPPRSDGADPDPFAVVSFTNEYLPSRCAKTARIWWLLTAITKTVVSDAPSRGAVAAADRWWQPPADLRHGDLRRAWVRQVPRPKVEARGDPHPQDSRLPIRSVPGPHHGRRAASASRRA